MRRFCFSDETWWPGKSQGCFYYSRYSFRFGVLGIPLIRDTFGLCVVSDEVLLYIIVYYGGSSSKVKAKVVRVWYRDGIN